MGYMSTLGYAEAVGEGVVGLEGALSMHLCSNFYPPLPSSYAAPLVIALHNVADGYGSDPVRLDSDTPVLPRASFREDGDIYIRSADLVRVCRAEPFIDVVEA